MKKNLPLSACLIIFFVSVCQSQNIDTTSVWRTNYEIWDPIGGARKEFFRNYINGDTLINGITYFKVYKSGYFIFDPDPFQIHYPFEYFDHPLRSAGNKWYTFDNNEDKLLYDFTLQPGDTVISAFTFSMEGPVTVGSVDSVMFGSEWKRQFHLNHIMGAGATLIIEDMGANSGLFQNMSFFEWDSQLHCFAHGSNVIWSDTNYTCDLNVSVPGEKINFTGVFIYPNPATDYIVVDLPDEVGKTEISICNLVGKTVFYQKGERMKTFRVEVKDFPGGIYFLRTNSGKTNSVTRLVVL